MPVTCCSTASTTPITSATRMPGGQQLPDRFVFVPQGILDHRNLGDLPRAIH